MKTLKTAVIGLGRIGWFFHTTQVLEHSGFELAAVCDPERSRLEEASSKYGVSAYDDVRSMFERENLDLVVIASPTHLHFEQTLLAFDNGCDVFCEKPVVTDLEQIRVITEKMAEKGRKFMVYQPHRARAEIQCLKDIISSSLLGDIYMIKRACSDYKRRNDWQAFKEFGGGMLNNYGSHYIDQTLHLFGSDLSRICYTQRKIASLGDAEDVVKVLIETEGGVIFDIDINMACSIPMQKWVVLGSCGTASMTDDEQKWIVRYFKPSELEDVSVQTALAAKDRSYANGEDIKWYNKQFEISDYSPLDYYQKCYEYFALDEKPLVPAKESMRLVEVISECRRQANTQPL